MRLIRLSKKSFFRTFEDIGYLVNEMSGKDIVLDECGAMFLSEIGREPKQIQTVVKNVASRFVDANRKEIEKDFGDLTSKLEADGFVITGQTIVELDEKEPEFSYSIAEQPEVLSGTLEESLSPSSDILKRHFWKYPRIFNMQIELTSFCNLRCVHCYLGDVHPVGWLEKERIFDLLDQLKDMGTLEVTFTGGEVFSRPDLPEILQYARHNDFSITLLTNNVLLTDSLLEEIKNTGVRLIQISLYSMKPEVHDAITRHSGSWMKTIGNIEKLITNNVPIQVGCPVMKENLNSFAEVIEWGNKLRFRVKPDLLLMARTDFSTDNLDHRLNLDESKQAIKSIMGSDVEYHNKLMLKNRVREERNPSDPICGVGTSTMCIAANGDFYPCPGFHMKLGNINDNSVKDVWNKSPQILKLRDVKNSSYSRCLKCESVEYCHICMAKFYNESGGDIFKVSEYICGVSRLNRELAEAYLSSH
jgi:radical SAM protein with 4Fe4S-binding SPASM domain